MAIGLYDRLYVVKLAFHLASEASFPAEYILNIPETISMARILLENVTRAEIKKCIEEVSKLLGIRHLLHRKPRALSGGQRQRVALGRAIFRRPRAFLFDELLSNLDAALLGRRIRTILRDYYDKPMILGIRPEDVSPHQPPGLTDNAISATVNAVEPIGISKDIYLTNRTGQKLIVLPSNHIPGSRSITRSKCLSIPKKFTFSSLPKPAGM